MTQMMTYCKSVCALVVFLLIISESTSLSTQIHEEVSVDLVEVYAAAVDKKGNPVTDLQAKDFQLKENGKEQKISHFTRVLGEESQTPLTLIFLLDTSGSMTLGSDKLRRIDLAKSFAEGIVQELKRTDQMELVAFDVQFRPLTPFTSDKEVIAKRLEKVAIPENRGTLMLGAIDLAAAQLENYGGRRIIVLCSDGERDWRDSPTPEELLVRLKRSDITLVALGTTKIGDWQRSLAAGGPSVSSSSGKFGGDYSIHSGGFTPRSITPADRAKQLLETLAKQTGGTAYFPSKVKDIDDALGKIFAVIQSQYLLAYSASHSQNRSDEWNEIEVRCKRKGVTLHYRKGYHTQ